MANIIRRIGRYFNGRLWKARNEAAHDWKSVNLPLFFKTVQLGNERFGAAGFVAFLASNFLAVLV